MSLLQSEIEKFKSEARILINLMLSQLEGLESQQTMLGAVQIQGFRFQGDVTDADIRAGKKGYGANRTLLTGIADLSEHNEEHLGFLPSGSGSHNIHTQAVASGNIIFSKQITTTVRCAIVVVGFVSYTLDSVLKEGVDAIGSSFDTGTLANRVRVWYAVRVKDAGTYTYQLEAAGGGTPTYGVCGLELEAIEF